MEGYIKIYRQLLDWEWYTDTPTKSLFIHLLLKANIKDWNWRWTPVQKWSLITGRKKLSDELWLTESQIRTSLEKLQSTNEIAIKTTKSFSVIQLNNWDKYQEIIANKVPNQSPTNRQPIATGGEGNKGIKKEDTTTTATDLLLFFNSTTWVNLKLTDKKKEQIKNRLKTFTIEEIQTAIKNRMTSKWHIDEWWTKDWDSLFCNDEKIDKMLNIKSEAPIKKVVRTFDYLTWLPINQ